jgi:hypothetical protein
MQRRNEMNTTIQPKSANKKEIKMNTQSDKNQKPKIISIFLGMLVVLVGGGLFASTRFGDEVVAPAIMFLFALCFSAIAAWSKKNQWAVIPAGFFASVGLVTTLEIFIPESETIGLGFMLLLAATFFFFAIMAKKNWWAIIPAGTFASLGLVITLEILVPHEEYPQIQGRLTIAVFIWVLFLGLAATFGALWLTRKTLPTNWTRYPAVGFLAMAVLSIIEGARFSEYWLVTTLLVIGVTLLLVVLTGKRLAAGQQVPKIKA